ncbi:MAG: hypothetical protein WC483_06345, partial [Candidatus Paceibacterota bacterium]
ERVGGTAAVGAQRADPSRPHPSCAVRERRHGQRRRSRHADRILGAAQPGRGDAAFAIGEKRRSDVD